VSGDADPQEVTTTRARRILVVDDDASVRQLVRDVLEIEGYHVTCAPDGYAALRAVEQGRPDCVVLDVMMPGLDGHDVLIKLRESEQCRTLPVVMLTAMADDDSAWQAWTEGVDYFLPKPFDPETLIRYLSYLFSSAA
jgi:CheY-like chemotaxis protein